MKASDTKAEIPIVLEVVRRRMGITQSMLADISDTTQTTISRMESIPWNPGDTVLTQVYEAINMISGFDYLWEGSVDAPIDLMEPFSVWIIRNYEKVLAQRASEQTE